MFALLKHTKMKKKLIKSIAVFLLILLGLQFTFYTPKYIYRVLVKQEPSYDYYKKHKTSIIKKSTNPFYFTKGSHSQENLAKSKFERDSSIHELNAFMEKTKTRSFVVVRNDTLLLEKYYKDETRKSLQASFSVTKSIVSMLLGIAIENGSITSIEDPITKYLPELSIRDKAFDSITIANLISMRSGIKFSHDITFPFVNSDSPKTFYHPDLRRVALRHTELENSLKGKFKYNDYNPLLIGLILEHATGQSISDFFQEEIWSKIGAEFNASWSSDDKNFQKTESGFNARPIDLAKIGRLALNNGVWNDRQYISKQWVLNSTQPKTGDYEFGNPRRWTYKYYWWSIPEKDRPSDFMAIGKYGQFIYISPQTNTIIVRNGEEMDDFGDGDWAEIFYNFCRADLKS